MNLFTADATFFTILLSALSFLLFAITLSFSAPLISDEIPVFETINITFFYSFGILNIGIFLFGLYITDKITQLKLRREFDIKSVYSKMEYLSYICILSFLGGSFIVYKLFLFKEKLFWMFVGLFLNVLIVLGIYFILFLLHDDLWGLRRRRDINRMMANVY